jgi:hypothetical protein
MPTWNPNLLLPFRATELSPRRLCAVLGAAGLVCLVAVVAGGCQKNTASTPHPDPAEPVPGIAATRPNHLPQNAVTCAPPHTESGVSATAAVSDLAAPIVTMNVPDGWNSAPGNGDTALTSTGPDGMSATVTITPTDLEPGGSFLRYTANLGGAMPRLKFSVAGGQFCGYSSQLLSMTVQGPAGAIDFADRITHIWTNTKQYLVAIHLEGPGGAAGFSGAKATLMQDFAVVIP